MRGKFTFGAGLVGPVLISAGWYDAASGNPSSWSGWVIWMGIILTMLAVFLFVEHRSGWSVVNSIKTTFKGNHVNVNSGNRTEANLGQRISGWFNRTTIHVNGPIVEIPEPQHKRRSTDGGPDEIKVTLFPSSGQGSELVLGVQNDGPSATFQASCRIFQKRNANSGTLTTYDLAWVGNTHNMLLSRGRTGNLRIAVFELDANLGIFGNTAYAQLKLVKFNTGRNAYEPMWAFVDDALWAVDPMEKLPEIGLVVTISTAIGDAVPYVRYFKVTPEGPSGPLSLIPLIRESLDD